MENNDKQLSDIGAIELKAIELKYEGYNYLEIIRLLEIEFKDKAPSYQTIRIWFMRKGKLYDMYEAYVKEQSEIRKKEALELFKAHIKTAVRILVKIAGNEKALDTARVKACTEIINRELGEPIKRAQIEEKSPVNDILRKAGLLTEDNEDGETN